MFIALDTFSCVCKDVRASPLRSRTVVSKSGGGSQFFGGENLWRARVWMRMEFRSFLLSFFLSLFLVLIFYAVNKNVRVIDRSELGDY